MNKKLEELLREKEKKWDTREEWGLTEPWLFTKQAIQEGYELGKEEMAEGIKQAIFYSEIEAEGTRDRNLLDKRIMENHLKAMKETKK